MRIKDLMPFGRSQQELTSFRSPFVSLRKEIDSLFDRVFDHYPTSFSIEKMNIDISENDKEVLIKADMPGVSEEDISLKLSDNTLFIKGEKKQEKQEERDNYHVIERNYGSFTRSIPLPFKVEPDKIEAELDKGVLTIKIPKSEETLQRFREIKINKK